MYFQSLVWHLPFHTLEIIHACCSYPGSFWLPVLTPPSRPYLSDIHHDSQIVISTAQLSQAVGTGFRKAKESAQRPLGRHMIYWWQAYKRSVTPPKEFSGDRLNREHLHLSRYFAKWHFLSLTVFGPVAICWTRSMYPFHDTFSSVTVTTERGVLYVQLQKWRHHWH